MPKPTHPIAWFIVRRLVGFKRATLRHCSPPWLRLLLGSFGTLSHLAPWLVIRTVCGWIPAPGDFSPALNRLIWGLPVYGFWYGYSAYWIREYCLVWVVAIWLALLPICGFMALANHQTRRRLRLRYRLPTAASAGLGLTGLLVLSALACGLFYNRPQSWLRGNAPDFSSLAPAVLAERISADERTLEVVRAGLAQLNARAAATEPNDTAARSQPQAVALRYRTVLLQLAWAYTNHARITQESNRTRAQTLHSSATQLAIDASPLWAPRVTPTTPAAAPLSPLAPIEPRHGEALFTPKWVNNVRPFLKPGDILLMRANGYRATGLLPGVWSQVALYAGPATQLAVTGLDRDMRIQRALEAYSTPDASGNAPTVIAAVGEGVIFTTLERTLGEADSVAILRPKLNPVQKLEILSRAFADAGKAYDFTFDFKDNSQLVGSELLARALAGFIDFPMVTMNGESILTADAMVQYWSSGEGGPKLDFVAFVDTKAGTGRCDWASPGELTLTVTRPTSPSLP